jgi:hypothetical protein
MPYLQGIALNLYKISMINSLLLASEIEIPLIKDLVLILGMSVLVVGLFLKLKLPTIVGFLITGGAGVTSGFWICMPTRQG